MKILAVLFLSLIASYAHAELQTNGIAWDRTQSFIQYDDKKLADKIVIYNSSAIRLYDNLITKGAEEVKTKSKSFVKAEGFTCVKFNEQSSESLKKIECTISVTPQKKRAVASDCANPSKNQINNLSKSAKKMEAVIQSHEAPSSNAVER